jgi:NADH-quinone oxidoreductase subunit G
MADVTFTVDGKKLTAPAGTLLIEACRMHGIEIPAFCYYPGLSLQAACRMCVVRLEKVPKLQTACTTPVAEGMVVTTESPEITQARKATIELLLGNHPLDCPVCDAGGECELQDMTFKYGAHESKFVEIKQHREEQQWSPVVYFDRPRCILCYRCVRVCGEGMDVWALGIQNRGAGAVIAPNKQDHLECEECGMCIDICPVGALTSGAYRYKTRPWEMNHVSTICTHCGDGCKTTLGLRRANEGMEVVRGDNRDKSGINGDFLCIKGRYAFDFAKHEDRLTQPLIRHSDGQFKPVPWDEAIEFAAKKLREIRDSRGGSAIGVIGSNRTTNEEAYLLQKFARTVLGTNNIDHHRTADYPAFAAAMNGKAEASLRDYNAAKAVLLLGSDPTEQHPLLAWQIRTAVRLHNARLYVANHELIKLRRQATSFLQIRENDYANLVAYLGGNDSAIENSETANAFRDAIRKEESLLVVFGSEFRGRAISALVEFGATLPNVKFSCLGDYANSRGAADMGLYPDLLPGYVSVTNAAHFAEEYGTTLPGQPGLDLVQMFDAAEAGNLSALYVVGSNPVARYGVDPAALRNTFVIVQDMFMTGTAQLASVIFPAANLYEKTGTVTNSFGDVQLGKKAADQAGTRPDFELIVRLAAGMGADIKKLVPFGKSGVRADFGQTRGAQSGEADRHGVWLAAHHLEPKLSPFDPFAIFDEIQRLVPAYDIPRLDLLAGNDQHERAVGSDLVQIDLGTRRDLVLPSNDTLFSSGTLGRYSNTLNSVMEARKPGAAEPPRQAETAGAGD